MVKGTEIWTLCVLIQYADHMIRDLRQQTELKMTPHNKSHTVTFLITFQVIWAGVNPRPVHIERVVEKLAMG